MKMLDLGCGNNKLEGWIGVDKKQLPTVDIVCDLESGELPFENDSIDKIRMIEVIEHIKNYDELIGNTFKVLKKDGKILVTTPDKNCIVNRIFHNYENEHNPEHVHVFTQKELENLFSQHGFKIVKSYKIPYKRFICKFAWFRKRFVNENIVLMAKKSNVSP